MGPVEYALRNTRARVERYGWTPRNGSVGEGAGCLINHLSAAVGSQDFRIQDEAHNIVRESIGEPKIGRWNDRQTSVDAIYLVLDRATAIANERGL